MLNEYKERKLSEWDEQKKYFWGVDVKNEEKRQFISDLIDEISKSIPEEEKTRDDGVLMEINFSKITTIGDVEKMCEENRNIGWNDCRETLINNLNNK